MTKQQIENILQFYNCPCEVLKMQDLDNYIDFYMMPLCGTTINKLKSRIPDISLMINSPVDIASGAGCLVLRVSKNTRKFYDYFSYSCNLDKKPGQLAIGLNPRGEYVQYNLYDMPHLLIAGQTGSGKSVFLHNCLISLMSNKNVCFRLIDLKRVELSKYNGFNCLVSDCITDYKQAEKALHDEVLEMQARYDVMEKYGVNHFTMLPDCNKLLPRVIVIDELADLMLNKETRRSVENSIVKIAQLGRAAGMHLILATQRPDRNVITGLIKANIPGKVAFTVANRYDAQVIGIQDAEKLNGKGDAIFSIAGKEPQRVQAFNVSDDHLQAFINQTLYYQEQRRTQTNRYKHRKKRSVTGFIKSLFS